VFGFVAASGDGRLDPRARKHAWLIQRKIPIRGN